MSVEIYKVIHIFGILLLFTGLAGLWGMMVVTGGARPARRGLLPALHGVGLLLVLISGFGMAGKLGYMASWPLWLIIKMVIWVLLGASVALAKRKADWGLGLLIIWSVLGAIAAYCALLKPF